MTISHTPVHTHDAPPPLLDLVREAVAQGLPCPVCSRTEPCRCLPPRDFDPALQRAEFIIAALRQFGYLPPEDDEDDDGVFTPTQAAEWLGNRSGFARYSGEGWRKILQADADVDVAASYALKNVPTSEVETVKALRSMLLQWHREGRPGV